MVHSHIFQQRHLQPFIHKALTHYTDENFIDCVSSFGVAAEDILTQVYETLFREQLSKGLTLGQLVDEIHKKISPTFKTSLPELKEPSQIYDKIKTIATSSNDIETQLKKHLEIIRDLATTTFHNNKTLETRMEKAGKPEKRHTIFPPQILNSINELIRYRNAASHKSRIPIGEYEAKRTAYLLVVFFVWWESEKEKVNWTSTAEEIIKELVRKNA